MKPEDAYFFGPHEDTAEIFESPKNIGDLPFWADNDSLNRGKLEQLKADPSFKEVGDFNGIPIYWSQQYFFTTHEGKVSFMVKCMDHPFPGKLSAAVVQIALWRERLAGQKGITEHVFWNHVYPIHRAVMTDNAQTSHGRQFWRARIGEATRKGTQVYVVNLDRMIAKPVKSDSSSAYDEIATSVYGDDDRHRDLRVLITDQELTGFEIIDASKSISVFPFQ
jgi:hypothetical protein